MSTVSKHGYGKSGLLIGQQLSREQRIANVNAYNENPKLCMFCSKPLTYNQRKYKHCSRSCSMSDVNPRGVNSRGNARDCRNCGSKTNNKLYCSNDCKYEYWEEQNRINGTTSVVALKKMVKARDGERCSICKLAEWLGKPIGLILDHIDGHSDNNGLENLRLVCGNCDEQLPTYKSRNKGNGRHARRARYANGQSY